MPIPGDTAGAIDTSRPSLARVYDFALGGKDNFAVDRELNRMLNREVPDANALARTSRAFLIRAVRFLAVEAGIDQYLDCGSGLPTAENTHQVAQRAVPESRVVYVDNDPAVAAHSRALLADNDRSHFLGADVFQPELLLADPLVRGALDFSRPLGLLHVGTLHHYDEAAGGRPVAEIMGEYLAALPSGSFLAFSHFFDPEDEHSGPARRLQELLGSGMGSGFFRTRAQLEPVLAGLDLLEPGLVVADEWWPDGPRLTPLSAVGHCVIAAVARKP
ncbi:SAM-dependent methyltransferase [Saccharopolyspora sp. MS10]|uniref:SAM-dependent methyltransferase n=1 Tax=Saccharopolyspora sp. MS10 TaxID=3385973 RepID=UPI00399F1F6F